MDTQAIGTACGGSVVVTVAVFWLHRRLAESAGWPGGASMAASVQGWLGALTALLTGAFLPMVAVSG